MTGSERKIKMGILTIEPHGPAWADLLRKQPDIELVSIWDYDKEAARSFAARCNIPFVADEPEEMLGQVNAVVIAGGRPAPKKGEAWGEAPDDHLRLSRPFLSEGLAVLIDKPLADTVEDGVEIIRLARSNGALLMSGAPMRFSSEVATLRELANNGSLGKIIGANCFLGCGVCTLKWYIIHMLDALSHIFGPGIDSVFAMDGGTLGVWEREFPHGYGLVVHWRDGRLATVLNLRDLADGASNNPFPERPTKILYPAPTEVPPYIANHIRIVVYGDADWTEAILKGKGYYLRMLDAFLKMIRTGQEPIPLEQTLETIQAMNAAARSVQTHQLERIVQAEELLG